MNQPKNQPGRPADQQREKPQHEQQNQEHQRQRQGDESAQPQPGQHTGEDGDKGSS